MKNVLDMQSNFNKNKSRKNESNDLNFNKIFLVFNEVYSPRFLLISFKVFTLYDGRQNQCALFKHFSNLTWKLLHNHPLK